MYDDFMAHMFLDRFWLIHKPIVSMIELIFTIFLVQDRSARAFIINLLLWEFFIPASNDGFQKSLSDSKSPKVSSIILSILADLNNAKVPRNFVRLIL